MSHHVHVPVINIGLCEVNFSTCVHQDNNEMQSDPEKGSQVDWGVLDRQDQGIKGHLRSQERKRKELTVSSQSPSNGEVCWQAHFCWDHTSRKIRKKCLATRSNEAWLSPWSSSGRKHGDKISGFKLGVLVKDLWQATLAREH